ncbi:MAG: GldG family protein [Gammaproteobacteria bacterium]|nr:MAG: GldG family protein [Gammaproteobacteria bacterium]
MMLTGRTLSSTSGLVAVAVLLLAINLLAGLLIKGVRFDMTENKLYTLSDGTRNILANLDEPVTLRFYFSEKQFSDMPVVSTYGQRVGELLEEYAAVSNGKLRLIIEAPEPFSDAEEQAARYGMQGVPVDTSGSYAWFGLVGSNSVDDIRRIPFFQPDQEDALEYTVSKLVYSLANPQRPVVGLMSGLPITAGSRADHPLFGEQDRDWFTLSQMKQSFDVVELDTDNEGIPENVDVLMIVHPRALPQKTLFAIDQYVLGGGCALVFLDGFSEADRSMPKVTSPEQGYVEAVRSSNLQPLMDAWGVRLAPDYIAVDRRTATSVMTSRGTPVDYVVWLTLRENNFNGEDFVTADLQSLVMASSGYLFKKPDATTQFTPLVRTSDQAMQLEAGYVKYGTRPTELLQTYSPGGTPLVLAARIRGDVKSAFPQGVEATENLGRLTESREPINVIVIADTDILDDRFWVDFRDFYGQRVAVTRADNGAFLINALENLSGSNDLISLRSRGRSARPFIKVAALKEAAEKQFRTKERALQIKLSETGQKISELQHQQEGESTLIMSAELREELRKFHTEQIKTRKELRNVQHDLTRNIEKLGTWLKIINIGLIPLLVILVATVLGVVRMRRMRRVAISDS